MTVTTLPGLRAELQKRAKRIIRAAYLLDLKFEPIQCDSYFELHAFWQGGDAKLTVTDRDLSIKPCQLMQFLIRSLLRTRGL